MRNLFDQYNQPENRLTHALAVCLNEDRNLLRGFLAWMSVKAPVHETKLLIAEQSVPGDPAEFDEEEAGRRGLPDFIIHDGASWCLFFESKVQAALTQDQLARHERTLRRRGFVDVRRAVLTKANVNAEGAIGLTWSGLYEWLGKNGTRSEWAERLRSYLRAAEVRLARENYLTEGTLTMFDGFRFSADNPYTYGEAKRLLNLAMTELRKDKSLQRLGMDPIAPGRGAITGSGGKSVWDFLSLTDRPTERSFTNYPHLTLGVHADRLKVAVTIPNGVVRAVRKRLIDLDVKELIELNGHMLRKGCRILARGGSNQAYAVQRHYHSQRSPEIVDARMDFKLETCHSDVDSGRVKCQPEWVQLFAELLRSKRANIQFGYVVHLPRETKGLDTRESLGLIVESWHALEPVLDMVRGNAESAGR